jgi:hypothetical protein
VDCKRLRFKKTTVAIAMKTTNRSTTTPAANGKKLVEVFRELA